MYSRVTQYKTVDGSADFNYLDVNYTVEVSREHFYWNASDCDSLQMQELDVISDSTLGALGTKGVIKTRVAGYTRRVVRPGDSETNTRVTGNIISCKLPGAYDNDYDTSGNVNSSILDMLVAAKDNCPEFEVLLVTL